MPDIIDIQTGDTLARYLPEWLAAPAVALDTEFFRERTYYPIAGLIQLCAGDDIYLIDPLAIEDLTPLRQLLESPSIVKVLHSASEDLEVFQRVLGCIPAPLADTQVGAALAGCGFGLGYQNLVGQLLGQELEKGETRSDWLQRPLSTSQRHYAAMDVAWLLPVYDVLRSRLESSGRLSWWLEEGGRTVLAASEPQSPENSWQRLKGAGRLTPKELAVLVKVCAWREREARGRDRPRGHILKDAVCLELARRMPQRKADLTGIEGLSPQRVRQDGEALLAAVAAGLKTIPEERPEMVPPPTRSEAEQVKRLRARLAARADELGLAPELLARRRDLEVLVRTGVLPPELEGWRRSVIGEPLLAQLAEEN